MGLVLLKTEWELHLDGLVQDCSISSALAMEIQTLDKTYLIFSVLH